MALRGGFNFDFSRFCDIMQMYMERTENMSKCLNWLKEWVVSKFKTKQWLESWVQSEDNDNKVKQWLKDWVQKKS